MFLGSGRRLTERNSTSGLRSSVWVLAVLFWRSAGGGRVIASGESAERSMIC